MAKIQDLVARLFPFAYSVTGQGNDDAIAVFQDELPFVVNEYSSGADLNGWVVAPAWSVQKAEIRKSGQLVYDGTASPLGVITLSESFTGSVTLSELKAHLFYSDEAPDAIVYHWTALYRPQEKDWGFCVPKRLYDSLSDGDYDIDLQTTETPGTMKVLDYHLPGDSDQTILFNAHNCHPFQANDDISGAAVGIDIMKRLAAFPIRRYSYRLVIAPELIGTAFWLDGLDKTDAANLSYTVMLKSVGNDAPLKLQESFTGQSLIDRAAHQVFGERFGSYESGPFRTIYGNDETVFEAPGYEIPSVSLTRVPFFGYHTDLDTPDRLSEARLGETVDLVVDICKVLEAQPKNIRLMRKFSGLICLSHPRYDLYLKAPAPGIDHGEYTDKMANWNRLMNTFPRYLDGKTELAEIAARYDIDFNELYDYAMRWVEKGLAEVVGE